MVESSKCCNVGEFLCNQITIDYRNENKVISVDRCIIPELCSIWNRGIRTIGSCCGHGSVYGYIQVDPAYQDEMLNLGYEKLPDDVSGDGNMLRPWCFKPKTEFKFDACIDKLERCQDISEACKDRMLDNLKNVYEAAKNLDEEWYRHNQLTSYHSHKELHNAIEEFEGISHS